VARKTVFVSDLSGKEIDNDRDAVTIIVRYGDARKGVIVVDAHPDDNEGCRLEGNAASPSRSRPRLVRRFRQGRANARLLRAGGIKPVLAVGLGWSRVLRWRSD
jgi:hypothetical protein